MAAATSGRPRGLAVAVGRIATWALNATLQNSANLLTAARLLAIPLILTAVARGDSVAAFWMFTAAALTDAVDGFIAKRITGPTAVGAVLDPLADKLLLLSLTLALTLGGTLPPWLLAAVVVRDGLIVTGAAYLRGRDPGFRVRPSALGKLCTFTQLVLVGTALASLEVVPGAAGLVPWLIQATALTLVASGAGYLMSLRGHAARAI